MRESLIVLMAALIGAETAAQQPVRFDRTRRMTPAIDTGASAAAAADMNGDSLDDLVLTGGTTRLWLGTPDGRLVDSGTTFPGAFRDAPVLLDLELDGDVDLAIAVRAGCVNGPPPNCAAGQNVLYENDGSGGLTDASFRFPTADEDITLAMAAGDVTGDGLPDLVLGQEEHCWDDGMGSSGCVGGDAEVWIQDGFGSFVPGVPISSTGSIKDAGIVRLADLDGDGDLDLYLGGGNSTTSPGRLHAAYMNDGGGAFTESPGLLAPPPGFSDGVYDTVLVDVEGDGDTDLVTTFRISTLGQARLYVNDGNGGFTWDPARLSDPGAFEILVTDFQSDGAPDLVLAHPHETRLATNDGTGTFTTGGPIPGVLGGFAADLCALDIGGDADMDLLLASSEVHLLLGDDSGAFGHAPGTMPWTIRNGAPVLFDADGDSDLDVAVAAGFLFQNDGSGQLTSIPFGDWTSTVESGVINVVAADLDGDGDEDLVGSWGEVFANEGTELRSERILAGGPGPTEEDGFVVASDFDQDGALDLAFGSFAWIGIHRNLGGLEFAWVTPQVLPGATAGILAAGDVDGDGADDLVGSGAFGSTQLFLNRPQGFVDASAALPPNTLPAFAYPTSYGLGDVDLDGDLDLMVATSSGSVDPPNLLFLNTGTGFDDASSTHLPALQERTTKLELVDFDEDGDLDAFMTHQFLPARLLTNDGHGVFSDDPLALPPAGGTDFVVGDMDGDDDLDLVLRRFPLDVLVNLDRQLAWDTFPRIGQPLGLELWGTPGAPWKLVFSPGRGRFLPALGPLFLEPTTLQVAGRGTLDSEGYARYTTRIPAEPGLVGLVLYGQALIGAPLRLSNLEVIRVTGF